MNLSPKPLTEATPQQRLIYARQFLNLDVSTGDTDEQIIALIRSAQPGNVNIFVEAQEEPPMFDMVERQPAPPLPAEAVLSEDMGRVAGGLGRGDPRTTIMIPNVDGSDGLGNHDVAAGVNGVIWQLKRGMDLDVPWRVVEALDLTESDIVRHNDEGDVMVSKSRRVQVTFPNGKPSAEELARWHAETDSKFCP